MPNFSTLQMAFCQTIYNLFGMLIFFPIPFIRQIPIRGAMIIGEKTAKVCFFFGLSTEFCELTNNTYYQRIS